MHAHDGADRGNIGAGTAGAAHEIGAGPMLAAAAAENVVPIAGEFEYFVAGGVLTWSPEMYEIYGLPIDHVPTVDNVLGRSHPDDTAGRAAIVHSLLSEVGPSSYAYRIVRPDGAIRNVVMAARSHANSAGEIERVAGHLIDVTEHIQRALSHRVGDALAGIVDARAEIEQAKGILMLAFGVGADKAFDVLAWQSQAHNIKVRDLAARIVVDVRESFTLPQSYRDALGRLLMTAYMRVTARA